MGEEEKWCVVTGGRGFAARHLVEMLIRNQSFHVKIADLSPSIKLESDEEHGLLGEALRSGRAVYVSFDLCDKSQVVQALQGVEVVFHMAAPDSSINNYQLHYSVNVEGTKNVIDACVELKVKRLVHTSSPSVVFDGVHGIINGEELLPYPSKHNDSYSATKAEGEALVLKSNGEGGLLTCCIRPSSIFGQGDRLLVPSLVTAARAGKSKFIIGDGNNMYDFTYVENVAHAHICAERALASAAEISEKAAGQAYFITNMEPIKFWEFVSLILEGLGYERPRIKISASVIMPIAHMVEWTYKILAPYGMKVPQLTPSRIRLLSCSRTFNCSKAKERLGYTPIVSLQEGINRTIESYSHLRAVYQSKRDGPSKASILLGNGKVAETLLWKDKRRTMAALLSLITFLYYFIAPGYSAITFASKLLLVTSIFLFIHGWLPEKLLGYKIEKVKDSNFQLSQETSRQVALAVSSSWNKVFYALNSLCKGNDWMLFFKVALSLSILSIIGTISLQSVFVTGILVVFILLDFLMSLVQKICITLKKETFFMSLYLAALLVSFIAFYVYEKKEEQIDALLLDAVSRRSRLKGYISRKVWTSTRAAKSQ